MKSKGFVTIYLLPLFLTIILISGDMLKSVTSTRRITENFLGNEKAINLSYIGLKHGIKTSKEVDNDTTYYINLIGDSIKKSDKSIENKYAQVDIYVLRHTEYKTKGDKAVPIEYKKVKIKSKSRVNNYSHQKIYEYSTIVN